MRIATLAMIAGMGLATLVGPAGATVLNPYAVSRGYPAAIENPTPCPAGWYWSQAHFDKHMQFWPTGCVRHGH